MSSDGSDFRLILLLTSLCLFCLPFCARGNDGFDQLDLLNEEEPRSRVLILDGSVHFVAGRGRNITFRVSNGSSILFGNTDVQQLPNSSEVSAVRALLANVDNQLIGLEENMGRMDSEWTDKLAEIMAKHRQLSLQLSNQLNASVARARAGRRIRLLILKLSDQIERLFKLMSADECLARRCLNGATCVDGFGKFQCLCPTHFEGKQCEQRKDECALFAGTDVGCQNGAICINNPSVPGITCNCTTGWRGRLCNRKDNLCDYSMDLCGEHGHCVSNVHSELGYRCFCESGFQLGGDPSNPMCVDVDECVQNSPCYPGANCVNLPGSFKCDSCPKGLIGNGIHCHDFDECASDLTNDCSKEPKVDCINTHGGYKCAPCPPDFDGDGFSCRKISRCVEGSSAVCHPEARCVEEPEFRCECPIGTVGDGLGPDGCEASNMTLCHADSCLNGGSCQAVSSTVFRCNCPEGYQGARCKHASPCLSRQFCSGHGRCRTNPLGCDCFRGFFGPRCQFEEDDCGFHSTNETGEILYERTGRGPLLSRKVCNWHIQLFDTRRVLQLQFLNYTAPRLFEITSKGCTSAFANLSIYDGDEPGESPQLARSQIAHFCHGSPDLQHPFYTSGHKATVRLSFRLQSRGTFLHLKWTAIKPRCGGRLSNSNEGRIDHFDVQNDDLCIWYIAVPPQFHIHFSVDVLRLPSGQLHNCSVNSLELFDGPSPTNRTRAIQLCASHRIPIILRTSGPFATVYFRLDAFPKCQSPQCVPIGFALRYTTIELPSGCGGEIYPTEEATGEFFGYIQSPNFPNKYFPNLDCLWILHSYQKQNATVGIGNGTSALIEDELNLDPYTADMKVLISFEHFDVPATVTQYANPMLRHVTITSCSGDFVHIAELDMTFCNLHKPPKTPIGAPRISLKFHSDASIGGSGFSLKYRTACEKDFTAPNGTISPPNFPNSSPRPFKCTYRIIAGPRQAIRIKFDQIGIGTDFNTCIYHRERHAEMTDYIELSGGHPSNEVANKRYVCARYPFIAPSGELVSSGTRPFSITYSTSGAPSNKGFMFSYELIDIGCGGVFSIGSEESADSPRQLTSPNYPDAYIAFMFCIYFIRVPAGKAVRLSFDVFDVENVAHRNDCDFDSVRVFDAFYEDEQNHGQLLGKFCGKSLPPPLLSTGGQMAVVFLSDRSVSGVGFSARFQAVDLASHCDRTFTAPEAQFVFDASEFAQADICNYRIVLPSNRRILLSVLNMSAPCEYGTLMVRNGPSEESPAFPGLFGNSEICDEHPQPRLISQGNQLFLRFRSDFSRSMRFDIRYEQFESGCGGHITGLAGAISSPQYPHRDSQTMRCEWLIAVAQGNRVRLQISAMDDFDSEDSQGKCSPFGRNLLEMGEGAEWTELKARHCRKETNPRPVQSDANSLSVRYTQHGGSHHGAIFGFMAQFSTECTDIVLEGFQGNLQSPGYPFAVNQPRVCRWTIRTSPGSRLRLNFHIFRITTDSLSYASQRRTARSLSIGSWNCRRNYLEIDPDSISQISGTRASISFVYNSTSKPKMPRQYCSELWQPTEIISEHNQISVDFQSRNEPENHFWLSWTTIGCGGTISHNNSVLLANASAEGDFVPGDSFRKCIWSVRAPSGYSIRVLVERMELDEVADHQKCLELKSDGDGGSVKAEMRDGVQFYADDYSFTRQNSAELPIKALCGRLRNETFEWLGVQLTVVFSYHADTSKRMADEILGLAFGTIDELDDHIVFSARVSFHSIGGASSEGMAAGGGVIHVDPQSDTFLHSPNYPKAYPKGVELAWQISAPEGFVVTFQILNLTSPAASVLNFGKGGKKERVANVSNPDDFSCGFHLIYLRGGLIFIDGSPNASQTGNLLYGQRTRFRICQEVNIEPLNITMSGNLSTVMFRGAPYDQLIASGDSPSGASPAQKAIGFRLRVYAKCGGTLVANSIRKVLNTRKAQLGSEGGMCEWLITREETDQNVGQRIFVRVEEIQLTRPRIEESGTEVQLELFCGLQSLGIVEPGTLNAVDSFNSKHFREFSCDSEMRLLGRNLAKQRPTTFLISYDTESTFCGGSLSGTEGRIAIAPIPLPSDCEWTIETVAGGRVAVAIVRLSLPVSEFCTDSFVEFREGNASGTLIGRYCGTVPRQVESDGTMWIRLRHKATEEANEMPQNGGVQTPALALHYTKTFGDTSSRVIEYPPSGLDSATTWHISASSPDSWIRYVFTDFQLPLTASSLSLYPNWCSVQHNLPSDELCRDSEVLSIRFDAASPPQRGQMYTLHSSIATLVFYPNLDGKFRLLWEDISPQGNGTRGEEKGAKNPSGKRPMSAFACGGELVPKWEAQTLQSPLGNTGLWYRNNERCKWTLRRPNFETIVMNVTAIELEQHPNCQYDFLSMSVENLETEEEISELPDTARLCRKSDLHSRVEVNSAEQSFVYFYTDRSRFFRGFSLDYSLICGSTEIWPVQNGILDTVLSSPGYPNPPTTNNHSCQWNILLLSRRDLNIRSLDMDLAPRDWQSNECSTDFLEFSHVPFFREKSLTNSSIFCGREQFNVTVGGGYVFIRFRSTLQRGRGFKLAIAERVLDCASSLVQLDQLTPLRLLQSPEFPGLSPNSLDCRWTLSAPAGRRLQLTVDPKTFLLLGPTGDDGKCVEDFLEVRDGPSDTSPLVGRYCKSEAPSTILSTGEHLHVRYVTDSDVRSPGWNATVELATCGGSIVLLQGQNSSIHSPNYPDVYPPKVRCEWTVRAPPGHFVEAIVEHIWLATTENCSAEHLAIRDGNSTGDYLQKPVCSRLLLASSPYHSSQQTLHVLFFADGNSPGASRTRLFCLSRKCGFRIRLWSSKFACGGVVKDDSGQLTPPGYPDQLIPDVFCRWDFRAGMDSRYLLELELPRGVEPAFSPLADVLWRASCFSNLEITNGIIPAMISSLSDRSRIFRGNHEFCPNMTVFLSSTDQLTLFYDGKMARETEAEHRFLHRMGRVLNVPFIVKYTKVPKDFDNSSCMAELTESGSVYIEKRSRSNSESPLSSAFCHVRIRKPSSDFTVQLELHDFDFKNEFGGLSTSKTCEAIDSRVVITDEHSEPNPLHTVICQNNLRGSNRTSLTLLNEQLELYVYNQPFLNSLSFNLTLTLHECGGVIDSDRGMSGELSSPNFGVTNYSNNMECLWSLRAPEGRVVSIEITFMDLESSLECNHDVLEVSSGEDLSAVIHRYCVQEEDKLADRFRHIRTVGHSLTLYFSTDSSVTRKGFSLQYAFVSTGQSDCGFNANSLNGTIQSPGFPADYPPNSLCVWDVQVPLGFHLLITFEYFDIVQSLDCSRDFLRVSEEFQSRAIAPLLNYWFYFDHESPGKRLCGNTLPTPIATESNRIRLNFTTDAKKSARGFKLRWKATCGRSVLRNGHGVITSPHYPNFYPNQNEMCDYLIDPNSPLGTTQVITLKVIDFDLDGERIGGTGRSRACFSDYLEIRDVLRNVTVQMLCGATFVGSSAATISIKGPIGVRFVINQSYAHEKTHKSHRGFKLSYAVSDCGGTINLGDSARQASTTITSPGFPLPYHHSLDCLWNVTAPSDRIISYKFVDLRIELSAGCAFDAVETFDGAGISNETRQLILCGDKAPEGEIRTSGHRMLVLFRTDQSANSDGFRMVVTATLGPAKGCGGRQDASGDWQKLQAPIDQSTGRYFPNLRCEWNIQAPVGKVVELRLLELELEQRDNVSTRLAVADALLPELAPFCYDYAAIYDGPKATSPFLMRPSCAMPSNPAGDQLKPSLVSSYGQIDVFFISDSSTEIAGGFEAEFRAVDAPCGGIKLASEDWQTVEYSSEKTLTRTNQRHKRCRWLVYSDEHQPVEVFFEQFSFPSTSGNCVDEFMELRDVGALAECEHPSCAREASQMRENTVRSCGRYAPGWHISATSVLQISTSVILQSQFSANFRLRFRALSACNRTIEIDGNAPDGVSIASGRLTSPHFPHSPYAHNDSCATRLLAAPNHRIFAAPLEVRSDGRQNCVYDSLTIYANISEPRAGLSYCGAWLPPSVMSEQNELFFVLETDASVAGSGYELSYYSVSTYSMFTSLSQVFELAPTRERSGALTSIGYPGTYPASSLMRATIIPPTGLRCVAEVLRADFGGDCRESDGRFPARSAFSPIDSISRDYSMPDLNSLEWDPWPCAVDVPLKLTIPVGSLLLVEFRSDSKPDNDGDGFRMTWNCEDVHYNEKLVGAESCRAESCAPKRARRIVRAESRFSDVFEAKNNEEEAEYKHPSKCPSFWGIGRTTVTTNSDKLLMRLYSPTLSSPRRAKRSSAVVFFLLVVQNAICSSPPEVGNSLPLSPHECASHTQLPPPEVPPPGAQFVYRGENVVLDTYLPWMAFVLGPSICTATVVSRYFVLIAGHCVNAGGGKAYPPISVTVYAGSANLSNAIPHAVERIILRSEYADRYDDIIGSVTMADMALLKLAVPLNFTETLQPIGLSKESSALAAGEGLATAKQGEVVVAGWGNTKPHCESSPIWKLTHPKIPEQLQFGRERVLPVSECVALEFRWFKDQMAKKNGTTLKDGAWNERELKRRVLAKMADKICVISDKEPHTVVESGDSGGPLLLSLGQGQWAQLGTLTGGPCHGKEAPLHDYYTQIDCEWIAIQTEDEVMCR
uniref:Cubilin n=1 Tax=Globodera rostochiensis TaxID=31243 RepID=A0A914H2F9_GLORO